jgi:hypothetical protein
MKIKIILTYKVQTAQTVNLFQVNLQLKNCFLDQILN